MLLLIACNGHFAWIYMCDCDCAMCYDWNHVPRWYTDIWNECHVCTLTSGMGTTLVQWERVPRLYPNLHTKYYVDTWSWEWAPCWYTKVYICGFQERPQLIIVVIWRFTMLCILVLMGINNDSWLLAIFRV